MNTNLTYAFDEMRWQGLLVKKNFMHSVEEAGSLIATEAANLVQAGVAVKGCCFYTAPDYRLQLRGYDFYLNYASLEHCQMEKDSNLSETVGRLVVRCLTKYHVDYLWNGNGDTRILVKGPSIRQMYPRVAKTCKLPAEAQYHMGNSLERPYWIGYSAN